MHDFDPDPILQPRQVSFILLITLLLFFLFAFWIDALGSSLSLLIGELVMILPALIYVLALRYPVWQTFRLKPIKPHLFFATIVFFVPLFILMDELDRLMQLVFPMPVAWLDSLVELVQFTSVPAAIIIIAAAVIVAPLTEEMLFRGLVQRSLEHFREPAMAIVLTSVLFALVHFNPWTAIQITLLGLVLGYITWKSGTILPAILIHALNNLLSLLLMNADKAQLRWYAHNGHVNILWIVAALLLIVPAFHYMRKSIGKTLYDA